MLFRYFTFFQLSLSFYVPSLFADFTDNVWLVTINGQQKHMTWVDLQTTNAGNAAEIKSFLIFKDEQNRKVPLRISGAFSLEIMRLVTAQDFAQEGVEIKIGQKSIVADAHLVVQEATLELTIKQGKDAKPVRSTHTVVNNLAETVFDFDHCRESTVRTGLRRLRPLI